MNRSGRFEHWFSGILGVVCLLLLNGLVRQFREGPRRKLVIVDLARSVSVAEHPPTSSREHHEARRIEAGPSSNVGTKSRLQPQAQAARHPLRFEQARPTVLFHFPEASPHAVAPPQPKTILLEPVGYVEKADGRVEAIISLEDRVHVVHEGEILEDNFRVTKISSSAVELVENSAPSAESQFVTEIGRGVAQAPDSKAPQMPPRPVREVVSNTDANRQYGAAPAVGGSQPSVRQELGYVERADGRVEAIIAEGEHVRLTPETKSFASNFHVPAPSPADLEVENALPLPINPSDSFGRESQPARTNSSTQEAGGPPLIALGSEPSTVDKSQGIPANHGESGSEPLGIVQPEPLADYSGSRFESRDVAPVPHAGPAGAAPSPATKGSGRAPKGGATPPLPSDGSATQSVVNALGYVEKAGGEKEAIVEVLGQVYLVHEGELFAGKYRALQVTSSSVRIVEESIKGSSLPSKIEPDSNAICPPVSTVRAPPFPSGSSGTDPPVEVRKAEELATGEPVVSPSRSPPEHPVESWQRPKGVKGPGTALESARPAERWAQTDTRSPPCALKTVGFVEKASGGTEAIVADEGGVYLVPRRRVPLDNPKIPNLLPGLEISPLGIRTLAFPDLLSGRPTTTFQTESPQTRR
jgi:hypothetical protein